MLVDQSAGACDNLGESPRDTYRQAVTVELHIPYPGYVLNYQEKNMKAARLGILEKDAPICTVECRQERNASIVRLVLTLKGAQREE